MGQLLSFARIHLSILDRTQSYDPVKISEVRQTVGKALSDLRDIAKSMSTERVRGLSLPEMAQHETDRLNRVGLLKAEFFSTGNERRLDEKNKLILFRIIQEEIHNIMKHAEAALVSISFNAGIILKDRPVKLFVLSPFLPADAMTTRSL